MPMRQVNIHDAKPHLSRFVAKAADGRLFVIARAGRPMVEVRASPRASGPAARIEFLSRGGAREGGHGHQPEGILSLLEGRAGA